MTSTKSDIRSDAGAPEEFVLIYDVVIAGARPVGLFLACELRLAGLSILVPEQAEDPVFSGVVGCARRGRFCAKTLAHTPAVH
jgi:thioredoxin reductase